jgi:hypothetical protein
MAVPTTPAPDTAARSVEPTRPIGPPAADPSPPARWLARVVALVPFAAAAAAGGAFTGAASGPRPLVDVAVVAGLAVVAPLALGGGPHWAVVALVAAIGMRFEPGPLPALAALPACLAVGWVGLARLRALLDDRRRTSGPAGAIRATDVAGLLPVAWAGIAVASLFASLAGAELFGIGEPIVRLTAVHYLYAGTGALTIALRALAEREPGRRLPQVAVWASALAPPVVAAGFVLGHPIPQIGGAVLMTVGIWATALALLAGVRSEPRRPRRRLRLAAGLTPWAPMVLAVAWATAQHVSGIPALSVPDMVRLHGLANGLGFVVLGLLATGARPDVEPEPGPDLLGVRS